MHYIRNQINQKILSSATKIRHYTYSRLFKPVRTLGGTRISLTYSSLLSSSIICVTSLSVLWLIIAKTDQIITVPGQLQPAGRTSSVQLPQGGIVREILVKEGQRVHQGQLLVELDNSALVGRRNSLIKSIANKEQQLKLKTSEVQFLAFSYKTSRSQLAEALSLEENIKRRYQSLSKDGVVPLIQFLQQVSKVKNLKLESIKAEQDFRRTKASLLQDIQSYRIAINEFSSQLKDAEELLKNQSIRSPVSGIVFDLKPATGGFVGQSTETIMKIVPQGKLLAKIQIPASDIGMIKLNQKTDIGIDAFPPSDFGYVDGKVTRIASDSLPPDEINPRPTFPVIVSINDSSAFFKKNPDARLTAGMTIKANIKLRKVSYFSLIFTQFDSSTKSIQRL